MPRSNFAICLLILFALHCGLAGCNGGGDSDSAGGDSTGDPKYRIAVIPKGLTHEFWQSVHFGAQQAADEMGVEILWDGPATESDVSGQIKIVQSFITKGVDGICLAPNDSQSLASAVAEAKEKGIPTVVFDSGLDADESEYVSYVATDNFNGGQLAAETLAAALKQAGVDTSDKERGVVLLRYKPGSESTEQREAGFLDGMKNKFPEINVLSSDQYSGTDTNTAKAMADQMLLKYGDRILGIFSVCEPNAAGTLRALRDADKAGKIKLVGFDPNQRMVEAIGDGHMSGIVLQDPVKMGYLAVKTMVQHLEGETVEKRISTGEYVAKPDNMDSEEMKRLLHPPKK